jgi:anti-sigma factor RsiW
LETGAQWVPSWKVLAPTALMILLALIIVPYAVQEARAANYVDTALATHRAYLSGNLSPEIRSNSPEEVTAWFAGKLQFSFRLPDSRLYPGKPAYQLTGARSVTYKGNKAALITYEAQKDKISLLIAPSRSAVIAGGDEIRSGSLTFHYQYKAGFKVITWSNHGLSYALVSTVSGSARESCLVCHQSMKDRGAFEAQE